MTGATVIRLTGCLSVMLLALVTQAVGQTLTPDEHGFVVANPEDLHPPGDSRSIRILGGGSESGMYVQRITFAPGTGSKPHFHDGARFITVIEGTWWVALGPDAATYNPDKMFPMKAGSFLYEPPNGIHYDEARDEPVTVQIQGMGPVKTTQVQPDQ